MHNKVAKHLPVVVVMYSITLSAFWVQLCCATMFDGNCADVMLLFQGKSELRFVLVGGEPIGEPVVQHGKSMLI